MARGSSASFENTVVQKIKDMLPLIYTQEISAHDEVALGKAIYLKFLDDEDNDFICLKSFVGDEYLFV